MEVPTQSVPGVAATNDDDVLAGGINEAAIFMAVQERLGIRGEEFHGKMDAFEFASRNGQVARLGGPGGEDDRVEFLQQFFRRTPAIAAKSGTASASRKQMHSRAS